MTDEVQSMSSLERTGLDTGGDVRWILGAGAVKQLRVLPDVDRGLSPSSSGSGVGRPYGGSGPYPVHAIP